METANETLVFVHGSGDSAQVWAPLIHLLPQYRSIALDLPGHGALIAEPGSATMSVSEYAAFVQAELTRNRLTNPTLIGHSLGGAIALQLALEAPSAVGRIVLVGSGARLRVAPAFLQDASRAGPQGVPTITRMSFAEDHVVQADAYQAGRVPTAPGVLYRDLAACNRFDVMAEVERITQPTLLVVGAGDRMTPLKYAEYLHARLPNSALVVIPDAGHYAQIEQPQAVADALRAWLA